MRLAHTLTLVDKHRRRCSALARARTQRSSRSHLDALATRDEKPTCVAASRSRWVMRGSSCSFSAFTMLISLRVGGYARSRSTRARMVGHFCGRASACVWGLRGSVCKRRFHGDGRGLSPPSRPFRGHILVFHTGPPTHFPCFYFTRVSASGRMDLSSRTMPLG